MQSLSRFQINGFLVLSLSLLLLFHFFRFNPNACILYISLARCIYPFLFFILFITIDITYRWRWIIAFPFLYRVSLLILTRLLVSPSDSRLNYYQLSIKFYVYIIYNILYIYVYLYGNRIVCLIVRYSWVIAYCSKFLTLPCCIVPRTISRSRVLLIFFRGNKFYFLNSSNYGNAKELRVKRPYLAVRRVFSVVRAESNFQKKIIFRIIIPFRSLIRVNFPLSFFSPVVAVSA